MTRKSDHNILNRFLLPKLEQYHKLTPDRYPQGLDITQP
jgi:hypothetical protein